MPRKPGIEYDGAEYHVMSRDNRQEEIYRNDTDRERLLETVTKVYARTCWVVHADVRAPLQARYADAKKAEWKTPADIKKLYSNASFVTNSHVVFNIKGNKYRLVVAINYGYSIVYVRFIGTHKEYDLVDVSTI